MAERRMFAKSVLESDGFLDLEPACQALYVQLNLQADDEGFVSAPKRVLRMLGVGAAAVDALVAAGLVLRFHSGILLIRHWLVHNKIRSDRRKGTLCQGEKAMVEVDEMGVYGWKKAAEPEDGRNDCSEKIPRRAALARDDMGEVSEGEHCGRREQAPALRGDSVLRMEVVREGQDPPLQVERCSLRSDDSSAAGQTADNQDAMLRDRAVPKGVTNIDQVGAELDGGPAAWQPSDNQVTTNCPHRIGKDRIGEDREEEDRAAIAPSAAIGCPVAAPSMPAASSVPSASSVAAPSSVPAASSQKDILDVFQFYHRICVGFMPCKHLTKERKAAIGQALENWTKEELAAIFEKAEQTPFLKGENDRKWRVGFDWLIQKENLQKVQEGQYDDWRLKEAVPTGGRGLGDAELEAVRLMMGMEA